MLSRRTQGRKLRDPNMGPAHADDLPEIDNIRR